MSGSNPCWRCSATAMPLIEYFMQYILAYVIRRGVTVAAGSRGRPTSSGVAIGAAIVGNGDGWGKRKPVLFGTGFLLFNQEKMPFQAQPQKRRWCIYSGDWAGVIGVGEKNHGGR